MPAKSQAQRSYLASKFGKEWLREHHYNTPGKLPYKVGKRKKKRSKAGDK